MPFKMNKAEGFSKPLMSYGAVARITRSTSRRYVAPKTRVQSLLEVYSHYQLIIVGDQSAGKSSLLQSLTDIPFPVSDRLCTRFPTRIVSRRTPFQPESIKVSIEPSSLSTFEDFSQKANIFSSFDQTLRLDRLDRYAQFTRVIPNLTAEGYKDILNEVRLSGPTGKSIG